MQPELRVLTLTSYGEKPEDNLRVTLSAMYIKATMVKDSIAQGRPVKDTVILFTDDSAPMNLVLNDLDLLQLESVVGTYGSMEYV